ncbi:glycerol-3-phosphate cytidylyltransferase [Pseudoalteromonas phenolica]|uniref:glycerol-3-phosphate cytidylyltransferase n=1 Tax=Pseudoalteromonas phenolica TaxID=161398 RepID=UPI00110B2B57|nr:glycerol-3-phosphate cytidylyltransferase [Pseudoalteromonas phenolica]TMN92331.1 glycerol-3-phosphate cytidylyltransferase [Pseudoalteromonas phenolica]
MKTVLTYGTFDLFHRGHVRILKRLSQLGDKLIVGLSTDEFNAGKGKRSLFSYEERKEILESCRYVDKVIPESDWAQKKLDVVKYNVDIFGMGSDWAGKFDELKDLCEVVYLDRTEDISTTDIKQSLSILDTKHLEEIHSSLDTAMIVVNYLRGATK